MPQSSYAYAVARTRVLETRMLDSAKIARLSEAESQEALRLLMEGGYGQGAQPGADGDVEPLIKAELSAARKVVWEITPAPEVTGLFLLHTDAHNLKALLKARILGEEAGDLLAEGGLFDVEKLQKCVADKDYRDLPESFKQALNGVEKQIAADPDPRMLSAAVDRVVFEHIESVLKKKKNAFARQYFAVKADFINVRSALRARSLGWGADKLAPMLVPGGEMESKVFLEALEMPADQLSKKLANGKHYRAIAAAVEQYNETGSASAVDSKMDQALMELVRAGKGDTFGLGPVVGYLLGREAEAKAVRLIFAAKRAGRDVDLPQLYA